MWDCAQAERILIDIQVPPLVAKAFETKMAVNKLADILLLSESLVDMLFESLQPSDFGARALGRSLPARSGVCGLALSSMRSWSMRLQVSVATRAWRRRWQSVESWSSSRGTATATERPTPRLRP